MAESTSGDSEELRDEVDLDRCGDDATSRRPSGRHPPAVQFSLRGLLWFMAACSAYFAQLPLVPKAMSGAEVPVWPDMVTVAVGWVLLAVFYLRVRFRPVLVVHCLAPGLLGVFMLILTVLYALAALAPTLRDIRGSVGYAALTLLVSCLFCLPTFVLMMIVRALVRDRPEIK